jgi:hypothetical protein
VVDDRFIEKALQLVDFALERGQLRMQLRQFGRLLQSHLAALRRRISAAIGKESPFHRAADEPPCGAVRSARA